MNKKGLRSEEEVFSWVSIINEIVPLTHALNFPERLNPQLTRTGESIFACWLDDYAKLGSHREVGEIYGCPQIFRSVQSEIYYQKTRTTITLGIDEKGIYIQSSLVEINNLKNTNDDFWRSLLELSDLGQFSFEESGGHSQETKRRSPQLFHEYKGVVFLMMRNYIISQVNNGETLEFGRLIIRWTPDTDFYEVYNRAHKAFQILYGLNYSLWRVGAQRKTKKWK